MFRKVSKWLRSKTGLLTLGGIFVLLLVVAIVGQQLGWWQASGGPGAAGVPTLPKVSYPDPLHGYTCIPSCDEKDGKFIVMASNNMDSFGGVKAVIFISVPGNKTNFELSFFDGDSGRDNNGNLAPTKGNWDESTIETTYTLFADPLKDGVGTTVVKTWNGNSDNMPNNAWFNATIDNLPAAKGPSQHYFYRLEATRSASGIGANTFKVRSNAYLTTGKSDLVNASLGVTGMLANMNDVKIVYPDYKSPSNLGSTTTYTGEWKFYFYVPSDAKTLEFWDGDFDRGTSRTDIAADTDDPDSPGIPSFADPAITKPQGAGGMGSPADDNYFIGFRRTPPVKYAAINPSGQPVYVNENPSGTEEWEKYLISTDNSVLNADFYTDKLQPGFYNIHIEGLDIHNFVWLRVNAEIVTSDCDGPCPPPCVWPGCNTASCPRTIGYWKTNVQKIYIQNRTAGAQESKETLDWAFYNIALASPLFRSGINVNAPVPISTPTPLTPAEANAILKKTNGNSMLDRALQQNLATWLNLASGKIGENMVVTIDVPSGTFYGTIWEALQEAQSIILAHDQARMERAKDIADMINNGQINTDPASNLDSAGNPVCTIYDRVLDPNKQPPAYDKMPKAPKPTDPPNPVPPTLPDPNNCGARQNLYNVENPTDNPFYGIKFNYQSGMEIKDGDYDEFKVTLPTEAVAAMTSINLEAKAGEEVGQVTLTSDACQINQPLPCEPVKSDGSKFSFTFAGATDNGDGTTMLTFWVSNYTTFGLSHVTIGLPAGVVPSSPTNTYTSQICPVQ